MGLLEHLKWHHRRLVSTLAVYIFPNDVLIERCALSAMNSEPQTLDETM